MGLFDAIKSAIKQTPLQYRGYCPKCEKRRDMAQKGILGQASVHVCLYCKAYFKKGDDGKFYFEGYGDF